MHLRFIMLAFLFLTSLQGFAQIDKFKAAYIFNICRFVEWPVAPAEEDFVIGVIDASEVESELVSLSKTKKLFGRKIVVKRLSSVSAIDLCHVLYMGVDQTKRLPEAVVKIGTKPTLLVSEKEGAIEKGSAINFVLEDKKLKFEVKKDNAVRQGLKVNSSLNKLAAKVY